MLQIVSSLLLFTIIINDQMMIIEANNNFLTDEDFMRGRMLPEEHDSGEIIQQMYNPNLFEGDIIEQEDNHSLDKSSRKQRPGVSKNALLDRSAQWPNGRLPYEISATNYTIDERAIIARVMEHIQNKTCITIVPKTSADVDYVFIWKDSGCYSYPGRSTGMQSLSLVDRCLTKRVIVHEFMHALGFYHEQARYDRDDYVKVLLQNVKSGDERQFQMRTPSEIDHLRARYDYDSVMHYSMFAFSKNRLPTIVPKQLGVFIGAATDFSETDLFKLNTYYNCPQAAVCVDSSVECPSLATACKSSIMVQKMCPYTCAHCPSSVCSDRRSWCDDANTHGKCANSNVANEACRKTCGTCAITA